MPNRLGPKRPFKGPTPEGVIQTVSIGEGDGKYLMRQGNKFPARKYLAVDPRYGGEFGEYQKVDPQTLLEAGVHTSSKKTIPALDELLEKGRRVRHFNFDMPDVKIKD